MTKPEAIKLVAMLAAYFRAEVTDDTAILWTREIQPFDFEDGLEAVAIQGKFAKWMPSLKDFLDTVRECQRDRYRSETRALPVGTKAEAEGYCSFAEFLQDNPDYAERVAALGEQQPDRERKLYGKPVTILALEHLVATDNWKRR